jgi:uncharacterized protein YdeI (YjbR/CyaY-like superfamily)
MKTDPKVDAYIAGAAEFARPILEHLRKVVHGALPGCEEAIKWGMPHFLLHGKNVAGMAAFKAHCAFTVHGEGRTVGRERTDGMGHYGKIVSLGELPPDTVLIESLKAAAARIAEEGTAVRKPAARMARPEIAMPDDFAAALSAVPAAQATYEGFPPGARREYLEWITGAKTAPTREKRIAQAAEWLAEGKKRNWKYEKC